MSGLVLEHDAERLWLVARTDGPKQLCYRIEALRQLLGRRPPWLAERLADLAMSDAGGPIRTTLLAALVHEDLPGALPALARLITEAEQRNVRTVIARHVIEHDVGPLHAEAIRHLATDETGRELYRQRRRLIGIGESVKPILHELAGDETRSHAVRRLATLIAGWIDKSLTLKEAAKLVFDEQPDQYALAIYVEGFGEHAIPHLRKLVDHDEMTLRVTAINGLAELGDTDSAERLLAVAGDPGAPTTARAAAMRGLGRMRIEQAVPALIETSGGEDIALAAASVQAMGRFAESRPAHEAALAALGRHHQPRMVIAAADALARHGDPAALPALRQAMDALTEQDHPGVKQIAEAIRKLTPDEPDEQPREEPAEQTPPEKQPLYLVKYQQGDAMQFFILTDRPARIVLSETVTGRMWRHDSRVIQLRVRLTAEKIAELAEFNRSLLHRGRFKAGGRPIDLIDLHDVQGADPKAEG